MITRTAFVPPEWPLGCKRRIILLPCCSTWTSYLGECSILPTLTIRQCKLALYLVLLGSDSLDVCSMHLHCTLCWDCCSFCCIFFFKLSSLHPSPIHSSIIFATLAHRISVQFAFSPAFISTYLIIPFTTGTEFLFLLSISIMCNTISFKPHFSMGKKHKIHDEESRKAPTLCIWNFRIPMWYSDNASKTSEEASEVSEYASEAQNKHLKPSEISSALFWCIVSDFRCIVWKFSCMIWISDSLPEVSDLKFRHTIQNFRCVIFRCVVRSFRCRILNFIYILWISVSMSGLQVHIMWWLKPSTCSKCRA